MDWQRCGLLYILAAHLIFKWPCVAILHGKLPELPWMLHDHVINGKNKRFLWETTVNYEGFGWTCFAFSGSMSTRAKCSQFHQIVFKSRSDNEKMTKQHKLAQPQSKSAKSTTKCIKGISLHQIRHKLQWYEPNVHKIHKKCVTSK